MRRLNRRGSHGTAARSPVINTKSQWGVRIATFRPRSIPKPREFPNPCRWRCNASGDPGTADLSLVFENDTLAHIPRLHVAAKDLTIDGDIDLGADDEFRRAHLTRVVTPRNDFTLLAEAKPGDAHGYSLSLGLIFWVGAEIARMYQEVGVELEKYHGNRGSFLPMAAKFVVGQDGLVRARQVDIEFRERMEPEALLAAVRGLRAA